MSNDSANLQMVIFSKKTAVIHDSIIKQKCHILGTKRSQEIYEVQQDTDLFIVWCAICGKGIIGPYLFENENFTGENNNKCFATFSFPWFGTTFFSSAII